MTEDQRIEKEAALHVAVGRLDFHLPMSRSLKDRRQVASSLTTLISKRFNVTVAEEGGDNRRQGLTLAVSVVANDPNQAREMLSQVADFVEESRPDVALLSLSTEVISGV